MSAWSDEELDRYLAEGPSEPVVMLNLLRFDPDGGFERYQEYVHASGGSAAEPIFFATGGTPLDAPEGEGWDAVALVRYPSRQAFVNMVRSEDFKSREPLKDGALVATVLQPVTPLLGG